MKSSTILVVDDEEDIRDLVSGVLEDEGYAVRSAGDSTSALDAIKDRRPSLVLLDVWLQGSRLDGIQLLQEITQTAVAVAWVTDIETVPQAVDTFEHLAPLRGRLLLPGLSTLTSTFTITVHDVGAQHAAGGDSGSASA